MNTYDVGDRRKLCCEIRNEDGDLADPTTVTFKIKAPDGEVTVYVLDTDAELVRDSTGTYHVYWDITLNGTYWWRFEASGNIGAAEEAAFKARTPHVVSET